MITRIKFDAELMQPCGLQTQELQGLGPLVVLAGPNGGGKSRYLRLVYESINRWDYYRHAPVGPHQPAWTIEETTKGNWLHAALLSYLPGVRPDDPQQLTQHACDERIQRIRSGDYKASASSLHVYLEAIARAIWNGRHPATMEVEELQKHHARAQRFNKVLNELLGTTVEPEPLENTRIAPRIFGRTFKPEEISVGQRVLITWAILLVEQLGHYMNKIVLLDEPEVYLHPDACVRAIGSLQRLLGKDGQIWIATHSLPLIAWARAESLYFVQDGLATFAGTHPSRVWRTLLGGDTTRDALLTFLDGDAAAAATRFASECLLLPDAAPARPDDPQSNQLAPIVADRLRGGSPVRVLELGAGRGRLAAAVVDLLRAQPEVPAGPGLDPARLTYIAYEHPSFVAPETRAACEAHLADLRALGADARYSTNLAEFQARDSDRVDLTVLANTLHEIPVEEWLHLFEQIQRASKPNSTLLVIEDQEPRIGELPHPRGFLILERHEWRALVDHDVPERVSEHNGRRLTAFEVPVARLDRARANLCRALQLVVDRTIDEIRRLRDEPADSHRAGRRHAFLAMLHLNATLAQKTYPPPP